MTQPPGFYPDTTSSDSAAKRWWTGDGWAHNLEGVELRRALEARVAMWVGYGWSVQSQSETQAVLAKGHRPNHLLHLVLSILTLGIWLIVWIILAMTNKVQLKTVSVSPDGRPVES